MPISPALALPWALSPFSSHAELPIVEGEATNMSAMKTNKLAKGADAGVVASRSV